MNVIDKTAQNLDSDTTLQVSSFSLISQHRLALMGFAAWWILVFHTWQPIFSDVRFLGFLEKYFQRIGFVGVDIFFFLSGIGLVFSIEKQPLKDFYFRRFQRLLIPVLVAGSLIAVESGWTFVDLVRSILGYHFYKISIYYFLWFIPAIITFYSLFPVYYRFLKRFRNPLQMTGTMVLLWYFLSVVFSTGLREDLYGFTNRIPIMLIGIAFGYLGYHQQAPKVTLKLTQTMLFVFLVGLLLAYLTNFRGLHLLVPVSNSFLPNFLIAPSFSYLFSLFLLKHPIWLSRLLANIGKISLELYVLQEWAWRQEYQRLVSGRAAWRVNLIFTVYIFLLSFTLFHFGKWFWKKFHPYFSLKKLLNR